MKGDVRNYVPNTSMHNSYMVTSDGGNQEEMSHVVFVREAVPVGDVLDREVATTCFKSLERTFTCVCIGSFHRKYI